ncbi:MAG: acetyl-CoA decarbonylase/synthase complex subunit gamma [Euryarchaeota archaeon]|nr:acetyl-CoA decarbonylase/synthase complex subunit gamma [Euryarchaeota archaeon]
MGLTALEIYKHLPKKNCTECGVPTCLAFAMQLASLKVKLEACPYVTEQAKAALAASSAPPIRLVKIGTGPNEVGIGDEVVLFRHDKTFFHPTALAGMVLDTSPEADIAAGAAGLNSLRTERVGLMMKLDMIAVRAAAGDPARFAHAVSVVRSKSDLPLVLVSDSAAAMEAGLKVAGKDRPLIHAATAANWEAMTKLAKDNKCPLAITAPGLDALSDLAAKVKGAGVEDIVLDIGEMPMGKALETLTALRRLTIKKSNRAVGYPVLMLVKDDELAPMRAALGVMKYASAVILERVDPATLYPLMTLRQNIYTDPQKPIQVKAGIYEIGKPTDGSPLMFTTNFSLTFFTVQGDIEKSKSPAYLMVLDTEGLSVMTAFAAGKLTPEMVEKMLNESGIKARLGHRKLIIPGIVARMSGKLCELTSWEVVVGPRDSSGIPSFMKTWK